MHFNFTNKKAPLRMLFVLYYY